MMRLVILVCAAVTAATAANAQAVYYDNKPYGAFYYSDGGQFAYYGPRYYDRRYPVWYPGDARYLNPSYYRPRYYDPYYYSRYDARYYDPYEYRRCRHTRHRGIVCY